jgi:hypothetical protein
MNETSFGGFLGIDISKDKFDAHCIDIKGEKHMSNEQQRICNKTGKDVPPE